MRKFFGCLVGMCVLGAAGCQQPPALMEAEYSTVARDPRRDTDRAREHTAKAIKLIKDDRLDEAEKELKAALKADLFYGPAHNNLGTVYYQRKKYYAAAWEFQYAVKFMPNHAEPKSNLGMVFETVGRLGEAIDCYEQALKLEPDRVEVAGNLARSYIRANRKDNRTRQLLSDLVLKDTRPEWLAWARQCLVTMGQPASASTEQTPDEGHGDDTETPQ